MPTPEEQLRAADPFIGVGYTHPDFDSMIARVTGDERPAKGRRSARLQLLSVATVVLGLIAVALYGIGSSSSGTSLLVISGRIVDQQVVALPAPQPQPEIYVPAGMSHRSMLFDERPPTPYVFAPGPSLSTTARSGEAYRLAPPSDGSSFVTKLARVFKADGVPRGKSGAAPFWTVGTSPDPQVSFQMLGDFPAFEYSLKPCEINAVVPRQGRGCPKHPWRPHGGELSQMRDVLTEKAMYLIAQGYLQRLGLGYTIGAQQLAPKYTEPNYAVCGHACVYKNADFPILIHGTPSDGGVAFTFNQRGVVIAASGAAYRVVRYKSYPLLSDAGGITALNATHPTVEGNGTPGFGSTGRPRCSPRPCIIHKTAQRPPVRLTLDAVSKSYNAYVLDVGTQVFLPVYSYSQGAESGGFQSWSILGVDPSAIQYKKPSNGWTG